MLYQNILTRFLPHIDRQKIFYVVLKGRKTGFFHTWIEVVEAIQGFTDTLYKLFNDYQQASTIT